jgi:hypothetical protein
MARKVYSSTWSGPTSGASGWWPSASTKTLTLTDLIFTVSSASAVSVFTGTEGSATRVVYGDFAANSGAAITFKTPIKLDAASGFKLTHASGNLKMTFIGYED